ncbi:MAG: hypothetical protein H2184_13685 [Candidatus Galacturonibacter soehngenii]|nr:hypothetical protein [Candidatus Galacturonibacter soehngenii]
MNIKQATGATITYADLYKEKTLNVIDFGAGIGIDPVTNTKAINEAISMANSMGGATVMIPEGEFKTYTIKLKSNVNLYLAKGANLRAAKTEITKSYQKQKGEGGNYDEPEINRYAGLQDHGHTYFANSLIYGENLENIMIYGEGLINGSCIDEETGFREYILQGGDPFDQPMRNERGHIGEWFGNKAIALVMCKNVVLKDFSILIGGHFAIIAEGVNNLLADHILVDTTRDAFDIDCCENVTVINSVFNSLTDDALVLKASFGAGIFMPTKNVLIEDCTVSGYDAGSVYAKAYTKDKLIATDRCGPTARVKLGTESTCGYDTVTIRRVKFERSRGFALEAVDISDLSNIIFTDSVMDNVSSSPIFIRAGERGRFPVTGNSKKEVVHAEEGNVRIDNVNWVLPNTKDYVCYKAKRYIPSYDRSQSVSVDGHSKFQIVNQTNPTKINMGNIEEISGKFYLKTYDEQVGEYVADLSKEIPKDQLCYYANAVGDSKLPKVHHIEISNIKVTNADPRYPILLMGLVDAPIEHVVIRDIEVEYRGGLKMEHAVEQRQLNTNWNYTQYETKSSIQTLPWLVNTFFLKAEGLLPRVCWDISTNSWKDDPYNVPELPDVYPEPSNWGILPAYGIYARHVKGLTLSNIKLSYKVEDERHAIVLDHAANVTMEKMKVQTSKGVAGVAKVTNHYKRHTNFEYVLNEQYFSTSVSDLNIIESDLEVEEFVVNAPAPGTPPDQYYTYETVPTPENGYTYQIETKDYPLPQTVFRPFLITKERQMVKVGDVLNLKIEVRNPSYETTLEETDGFIYNEAVTNKDYVVNGVDSKVIVSICNLPDGASFSSESNVLSWKPRKDQIGLHECMICMDDGIIKEEARIRIEVIE